MVVDNSCAFICSSSPAHTDLATSIDTITHPGNDINTCCNTGTITVKFSYIVNLIYKIHFFKE